MPNEADWSQDYGGAVTPVSCPRVFSADTNGGLANGGLVTNKM